MGVLLDFIGLCRDESERLGRLLAQWAAQDGLADRSELPMSPAPEEPFALAEQLLDLRRALPGIEEPFVPRAQAPEEQDPAQGGSAPEAPFGPAGELSPSPAGEPQAATAGESAQVADVAAPAKPAEHPGELARQRITRGLFQLGMEIAGCNPDLLERLSEIVFDSQMSRALLLPGDSFQVGGASVMGAMALANLSYECQHGSASGSGIDFAFRAARRHADRFATGDLLFWELLARSVAAAQREGTFGPLGAQVLARHLPGFVAHSVLAKLDLAFDLPMAVMKRADYQTWPGLSALVAAEGARSIRTSLLGRFARRCADNPPVAAVVAGRWLEAMSALAGLEIHSALMAGRFLWEVLETGERTLAKMARTGRAALPLQQAVARVEDWRRRPMPDAEGDALAWHYLRDVASCLDDFADYRALCGMGRLMVGPSSVPTTAARGADQ